MLDFLVIGGAQAGLTISHHLHGLKKKFLVVDANEEIGGSWLKRWDSLTLFTPSEYNNLPGMQFPAKKGHYPNKYEISDYFQQYVKKFEIPIELNTLITSLVKKGDVFEGTSKSGKVYTAKNVIIATGPFHTPYTPPCHLKLDKSILQIHSNNYKNVAQLQSGNTLVVGDGDSGFQILDEISKNSKSTVYFSGSTSSIKTLPQEMLGKTLWYWFTITGFLKFSKYSFIGKRLSTWSQPIIGTDVKEILSRDNILTVGHTRDSNGRNLIFDKRSVDNIKNVIWATGYRPNFNWIEGLELDKNHYPKNFRGISNIEGLFFIGLPWMHTRGSATLGGVKKDAKYLIQAITNKKTSLYKDGQKSLLLKRILLLS